MQLAIDSASDDPGIALAVDGVVGLSATWHTDHNHSAELLPNIDRLLAEAGRAKTDLTAVFVDAGPGGYAALRVGVSVAKAIAHSLAIPIAAVGRLELDALGIREHAGDRRIIAVHRAGRGDVAWAAYRAAPAWHEEIAPHMTPLDDLFAAIVARDILAGDLDDAMRQTAQGAGATATTPDRHRIFALAALGDARLAAGDTDDPAMLVPLYLRAPAIGPQRSS